jgi:hypothetical protein
MSDRYQIVKKIGQGGIGAVYEAFDTQLKRQVALKRVLTPDEASPDAVAAAAESLLQEATTMSTLNHPNIVTVYDVGKDEQGGFVVMELLRGETLDQTIAKALLTLDDFREVVNQTLEGLIAAQAADMMHRDLKPGNIMVIWRPSGKFQIKILDFGLAKVSQGPTKQTIDQGDAILGSIFFMAPEQFERAALTFSADLYAMGAIYYFTLTGKYPFNGPSAPAVMAAHLRHDVVPLQTLRPDLPDAVSQWVMWLLNRNPEDRPQSAREALDRFPPAHVTGPVAEAVPVAAVAEPVATPVPARRMNVPAATPAPAPASGTAPSPAAKPAPATRVPAVGGGGPATKVPVAAARAGTGPVPAGPKKQTGTQAAAPGSASAAVPAGGSSAAARIEAERQAARKTRLVFIGVTATSALALTVAGVVYLQKEMKVAGYRDRIEALDVENPEGTAEDVPLLARFLSNDPKEFDPRALGILANLRGPGVDQALIAELGRTPSGPIRTGLIQAISNRNLTAGFDPVLGIYRSASGRERAVAAEALRWLARPGQEGRLLPLLADAGSERATLETAIIQIMRQNPDVGGRSEVLLDAMNQTSGDHRKSLARILGALGGERALSRLTRIINEKSSDASYLTDAILALNHWPDRTAGPVLRRLVEDPQPAVATAASRAYVRLLSLPGTESDDPANWKFVLEKAPRADAMKVFSVMLDRPEAASVTFLKAPLPGWEPMFQQALKGAETAAKNAIPVVSGELLPVNRGRLRGEPDNSAYYEDIGAMIWVSPRSWIQWTLHISEPGTYRVEVLASAEFGGGSQFSVLVAGQRLGGETVGTKDKATFVPAKLAAPGSFRISPEQAGVHVLVLQGGAVTKEKIMNVKGIKLTREP